MLDHVSLPVADLARAAAFYDRVLVTIGLSRRKERSGAIGYGPADRAAPVFWLLARRDDGAATPGIGLHVSFVAPDRASVDAFHAAALAAGGKDNGKPGVRTDYGPDYYAAFVVDPDGYRIEAHCTAEA
jgi:catechol 2,3-dioxygenase-like lactoylglutathione lyase family enzyme